MSDRGLPSRTNQDQRRWAGQTLDISTSISADRVRRRALEKLADEEFVPPEAWHEALGLLLDQVAVVRPVLPLPYYNERENSLRQEVEKLAAEFFDIPPKQRRERWNKLHGFSKHWPPLRQWLEQLEPGLDTSFPALDAESVSLQKLIRLIGDAFVLPPSQRARLMLEKFPSMMNSGPFWKPIVKTLRRDFPEIAALNEPLLAELTGKHQGGKRPANTTTRRGFFSGKSNTDPSNRDSLVLIWFILALLMGALRACNSSNSRNRRAEIPRPPSVIVAEIREVQRQIDLPFDSGGRGSCRAASVEQVRRLSGSAGVSPSQHPNPLLARCVKPQVTSPNIRFAPAKRSSPPYEGGAGGVTSVAPQVTLIDYIHQDLLPDQNATWSYLNPPLRKGGRAIRYVLLQTKIAIMDWPAMEATPS